MRRALTLAVLLVMSTWPLVATSGLFARGDVVDLTIRAPLSDLFRQGRSTRGYRVAASVTFAEPRGSRRTVDGVELETRGHTSLRLSECSFPKLKLRVPDAGVPGWPFEPTL